VKRRLVPFLIALILSMGLAGCSTADESTQTTPDTPVLGSDEACALVYNYLQDKGTAMTHFTLREKLLGVLDTTRPYFIANYEGNGKWQVSAVGIDPDEAFSYTGGLWNLYEASRAIEPGNDQAVKLLSYIQRWTLPR